VSAGRRNTNMTRSLITRVGLAVVIVVVLGAAGAAFLLLHGQAGRLGLAQATPRSPAPSPSPDDPLAIACRRPAVPDNSSSGVSGLWTIQPGSIAGYRAHEKFAELTSPHEAVARTESMSGWILVGGQIQIQAGCIAVDVQTLQSVDELPGFNTADRDKSARDMLGARSHPYVVFQPYPVTLQLDQNSSAVQHVRLAGDLQISGVTKPATFSLDVRLKDKQLSAAGTTNVNVGDFGVQVPQEAGQFVQVDPNITLEVSLILLKP
jgi:YceI-like protein